MDFGKSAIVFAGLAVLFSVVFVGYGIMLNSNPASLNGLTHSDEQFEEMSLAELEDKCAVPEGYTEADWKQHMSHHPDRYKGCDF